MAKARMQIALNSPADQVWAVVGPFENLSQWHPMITKSEVSKDGKIRTLSLPDGSTSQERLITHDDKAMQYRYTLEGASAMPVKNYQSAVTVMALGERTLFTWEADFDVPAGPPEAQVTGMIQRIYDAAAPTLKERFGG